MQLPKLTPGKRFALPRPAGSSDALLLAHLGEREKAAQRTVAIVTADASDARRLIDEMAFFAPALRCAMFPDWEPLPYDSFSPHQDLISERLATLWRISQGEADLVIVPVGGGGCIAGITTYLAERTANTAVLGIEPAGAAAMMAALAAGEPVTIDHVDQFVDGAAVNRAGTLTYLALSAAGDMVSVTTVDEGAVCTAMLDLYQNEGIIAEPAGALAVAGLMETEVAPGATVVCLISGGNNDVSRYGEVLERSLVHLGLKHYFLVDFPQEPGALRRFLDEVLGPNDDITLFEYVKRSNRETGPALVGIELGDGAAEPTPVIAHESATSVIESRNGIGAAVNRDVLVHPEEAQRGECGSRAQRLDVGNDLVVDGGVGLDGAGQAWGGGHKLAHCVDDSGWTMRFDTHKILLR